MQPIEAARSFLEAKKASDEAETLRTKALERCKTALGEMNRHFGCGGTLSPGQMEVIAQTLVSQPRPRPKAEVRPKAVPAPEAPEEDESFSVLPPFTLKARVRDALDAARRGFGMFTPEETKTLLEYLTWEGDGRSQVGRAWSARVSTILALPAPLPPGPTPMRAIDAVVKVIKEGGTMNAGGILRALEVLNQVPRSHDPITYINFILSQNKELFERDLNMRRGYYRLVDRPQTLKEHAEAAITAKKFHDSSSELAFLKAYVVSKEDGRSAVGRAMSKRVAELLGLPIPKTPTPAPQAPVVRDHLPTKEEVDNLLCNTMSPLSVRGILAALNIPWTANKGKHLSKMLVEMDCIRSTKPEEVQIKGSMATAYWARPLPVAGEVENPFDDDILGGDGDEDAPGKAAGSPAAG